MSYPLSAKLPKDLSTSNALDQILDGFLSYVREKKVELYPAQEEAILELYSSKNVILNTPTGSGKSLVALSLHFCSLANQRRSIYTSPIKALVNEKFFSLCNEFGPEKVGMVTGDATVNASAPIICCTAEILAIDALRQGENLKVDDIIMDEFHYYSDQERGSAWQIPLLTLPQARFLLMSATIGNSNFFEKVLTDLNGRATSVVKSSERPVPLDFKYSEIPVQEAVMQLIRQGRAPIYLVNFTQRECAEEAQNFMSIDLCTPEEKKALSEALIGYKFSSPYGKEIQKFLKHGMGLHHAGLLPKYRMLVERLAQKGLMKIIFGTDTLGVGVNVPIRTVLFTKLCKFDGRKTTILSVRDFQQISGRAGRKGFDNLGTVVVQAPEHVIENLRNENKAAGDPKKLKKLVKKKPPDKGFISWTEETFQRLVNGQPEPLTSQFRVTHALLLSVLSRPHEDGCEALRKLISKSHESLINKKKHRKHAFVLFRSLWERKIVETNPLRVNVDLQEDFSLNHALSLYLVDALKLLDLQAPDYALVVLTLAESILESPDIILRKQLDRLKSELMAELKAQGLDFEDRIAELDKLEHPKPHRDFIYQTFNEFAEKHPWVGEENIRPKSIAREMYENFFSFPEYIREYDLQRAEGILLRYLSDVYKTLVQNVPELAKTDELDEIILYFGAMVREVDSSLLDDWEQMRAQRKSKAETSQTGGKPMSESITVDPRDITRNKKAFTIMVRNSIFHFLKCLARTDFEGALSVVAVKVPDESEQSPKTSLDFLKASLMEYRQDHARINTDTKARSPFHTQIEERHDANPNLWRVTQTLCDPDEKNDWFLEFEVDLEKSRSEGKPVLTLLGFSE